MSPTPTSILLLGAGELGTSILSAIASHPTLKDSRVTLALRPTTLASTDHSAIARLSRLQSLSPNLTFAGLDLSLPTAKADLVDLIRSGKTGHDTVISCTGYAGSGSNSGTQVLITAAVLESGGVAKRYFPWQFGADYDAIDEAACGGLMREQIAVRRILRKEAKAQGLEWLVVSAGMFMSFAFEDWFGVVEGLSGALRGQGGKREIREVLVRGLGGWDNKVTLTAAEDIGRCVAELLANPPQRNDDGGSVVFIGGETVAYARLADILDRVVGDLGGNVAREAWASAMLKEELERDPDDHTKKYRAFFGDGKGVSWNPAETLNVQRGMEMADVEGWLRERLGLDGKQ